MTNKPQSPLTEYLRDLLVQSGLSIEQFLAESLGYRDSVQGLRDFNEALAHGSSNTRLLNKLKQFAPNKEHLDEVLEQTQMFLQAEAEQIIAAEEKSERRSFVPHISPDFESIGPPPGRLDESFRGPPTPKIRIPREISELPVDEQFPLLKPLIQKHYARYGQITENNERIDGYRGWLSLADWDDVNFHIFDIEGNHIPDEPAPPPKLKQTRIGRGNEGKSYPTGNKD